MAKTTWTIDPTHSEIGFKVKHMMFSNVSGRFEQFSATGEMEDDNLELSSFSFNADAASISTGNADRDGHLKGADFFDAENHGQLTFQSSGMKKVSDSDYELTGDLTIKGVSKPVALKVEFGGIGQDPWGNTKAGFTLNGTINRKDWGLSWNAPLEAGGVLVSEDVRLNIDVQMVKG